MAVASNKFRQLFYLEVLNGSNSNHKERELTTVMSTVF
jgi:hypothetical protein